jgi:hypothetical protein
MRQSQSSVLPERGRSRNRPARIDALWPAAIGGAAALVVSGFMMVSYAPTHVAHDQHPVTHVHGGRP